MPSGLFPGWARGPVVQGLGPGFVPGEDFSLPPGHDSGAPRARALRARLSLDQRGGNSPHPLGLVRSRRTQTADGQALASRGTCPPPGTLRGPRKENPGQKGTASPPPPTVLTSLKCFVVFMI